MHVFITTRPDGSRWTAFGGEWVQVFGRDEFLRERWDYQPGDHVSVIGPTQLAGKTRLMFDLLDHTDTSWCKLPPTMLVAKPRDPVVTAGIARLGYTETDRWPPRKGWFRDAPRGYAYWPKHLKNASSEDNTTHISSMFRPALNQLFWSGDTITVADEYWYLMALLKLQRDGDRHLTQGGGMGAGLWLSTQKPSGTQQGALSGFTFNSPTHTFLSRDPDANNRKRFREIGGVDPKVMESATFSMPPYTFLYVHRNGPKICVVEAA